MFYYWAKGLIRDVDDYYFCNWGRWSTWQCKIFCRKEKGKSLRKRRLPRRTRVERKERSRRGLDREASAKRLKKLMIRFRENFLLDTFYLVKLRRTWRSTILVNAHMLLISFSRCLSACRYICIRGLPEKKNICIRAMDYFVIAFVDPELLWMEFSERIKHLIKKWYSLDSQTWFRKLIPNCARYEWFHCSSSFFLR